MPGLAQPRRRRTDRRCRRQPHVPILGAAADGDGRPEPVARTAAGGGAVAGDIGAAEDDGTLVLASYDGTGEMDISTATDQQVEDFIQAADFAISDMTSAATNLGAAKARIDLQNDFIGKLMDSIDRGISALVDADMNEESTRLQALQVQQQLGVQALSIANQAPQSLLTLFR